MKLRHLSRKHILRAIQAVMLALFYAACSAQAGAAPTSSAEFTITGTTVTGSGTNTTTAFFTDPTTPSPNAYVVTIQPLANLGNTGSALITFDNGSVSNSQTSTLSGASGTIVITTAGTVNNAGTINTSLHTAVSIGTFLDPASSGSVTNSGAILSNGASGSGILIFGNSTVNNSGSISGTTSGIYLINTGTQTSSVVNSGSVQGVNSSGVKILGNGAVSNGSTGTIVSTSNAGVYIGGNGTMVNAGTITSQSLDGIDILGAGTVVSSGTITGSNSGVYLLGSNSVFEATAGTISGGNDAVLLGGIDSTVSILGRAKVVGVLNGNNEVGSTLNLRPVGMTPAEAAAANQNNGLSTGTFTIGTNTYDWANFDKVNVDAISLETVVDPGLTDVATKIDNNASVLSPTFDAFFASASNNPEAALNSLVGREFYNAFASIGLGDTTTFAEIASARAYDLRTSPGGFDMSGLNVRPDSLIASLGDTSSRLSRMAGPSAIGGTRQSDSVSHLIIDAPDELRWGAWVAGTVTFADQSSTDTAPGYNATTGSPTVGIDYRISHNFAVGALMNYTTTGADFADGSTLDVQTGSFGLYGTWSDGPWYVNALAAGGLSAYDNKRVTLSGATATSKPSGSQVVTSLSGGRDFKITSHLRVSPEVGMQYTHLTENSYNEGGAGAYDLNVAEQNVDSFRSRLGFRIYNEYAMSGVKLSYQWHAIWYHEFLDDGRGVSSSLAGASSLGSFNVQTDDPERDFVLLGFGLNATPEAFNEALTFFINYDAQVGQNNYLAHTVNGGVRYLF